jgi:hypothetical protein
MPNLLRVGGTPLLDRLELPFPPAARIVSLPTRIMDCIEFETELFTGMTPGG